MNSFGSNNLIVKHLNRCWIVVTTKYSIIYSTKYAAHDWSTYDQNRGLPNREGKKKINRIIRQMTWHYIVRLNKFKEQQQQKSEVNKVKLRERPAYKRFQLS